MYETSVGAEKHGVVTEASSFGPKTGLMARTSPAVRAAHRMVHSSLTCRRLCDDHAFHKQSQRRIAMQGSARACAAVRTTRSKRPVSGVSTSSRPMASLRAAVAVFDVVHQQAQAALPERRR